MVRSVVENHRQTYRQQGTQNDVYLFTLFVPYGILVLSDTWSSNSGLAVGKKKLNAEIAELGSDFFKR